MSEIVNGIGQFANSLIEIIGGSLNADAVEGIIALFCIGIIIRLVDTAPKIPGKVWEKVSQGRKRRDDDDEDDYEYIRVRRQRR